MNPTYLGEIDLSEETLAHFGVKGMRWGRRRARKKAERKRITVEDRKNRRHDKYVADHIAEDISKGKRDSTLTETGRSNGVNNPRHGVYRGYGINDYHPVGTWTARNTKDNAYVDSDYRLTTEEQLERSIAAQRKRKTTSTRPRWGNRQY